MTRKQERTLSMYIAVVKFIDNNAANVSNLPNFALIFNDFKTEVDAIKAVAQQRSTVDSKDKTLSKTDRRNLLQNQTMYVVTVLKAYFAYLKDNTHNSITSITSSELKRLPDTAFSTRCQDVYNLADSVIADLQSYGIDANALADLQQSINLFGNAIPDPRLAMSSHATFTTQLANGFIEADKGLENLTTLVAIKEFTDKNFYLEYIRNTKVVNLTTNALAFRTFVKDANGVPQRNVKFSFYRLSDNKMLEYATNKNGMFQRQNLLVGDYQLTISKQDYAPLTIPISIQANITFDLNIIDNNVDKTFEVA